jgi:hypothetical protein
VVLNLIHGRCCIPAGYKVIDVPEDATFDDDDPRGSDKSQITKISCDYNSVKALIALGQSLFAITTLYLARGDQIATFGYAAFGLTVAPYAFMSVVNLFGHLMCPDYPSKYLVESEGLRHLQRQLRDQHGFVLRDEERGIFVEGVVGKLTLEADRRARRKSDEKAFFPVFLSFILGIAIPLAIIGGLSRFHKGSATVAQRVWTMCWLAFGVFVGYSDAEASIGEDPNEYNYGRMVWILVYCAPAIGGFVVVGQMISHYGVCTRIT